MALASMRGIVTAAAFVCRGCEKMVTVLVISEYVYIDAFPLAPISGGL
jgi:hypothetical protein